MKEIRTARLLLRPFRESDCDDLFEFLYQLRDDEFEGYPGITYENGREHFLRRLGSEDYAAIELTESGKLIGNVYCGMRPFEAREIGYIVNGDFRRQGYAFEAVSAIVGAVFREGAHRVCAECDPRNERSWRLLEKLGLRREAHLKQNVWFHRDASGAPAWKDTFVYAMLAGNYNT